jgi:hypothetical protein
MQEFNFPFHIAQFSSHKIFRMSRQSGGDFKTDLTYETSFILFPHSHSLSVVSSSLLHTTYSLSSPRINHTHIHSYKNAQAETHTAFFLLSSHSVLSFFPLFARSPHARLPY